MSEDLKLFCSTDVTRPELLFPWYFMGYTYASDARIAVRVRERAENTMEPFHETPAVAYLKKAFTAVDDILDAEELEPLNVMAPERELRNCDGCEGMGYYEVCEACEGSGQRGCVQCGSNRECEVCQGKGEWPTSDVSKTPCVGCAGKKVYARALPVRVSSGIFLREDYLRLIAALPDAKLFIVQSDCFNGNGCVFSFSYKGRTELGILMPMRIKEGHEIIVDGVVKILEGGRWL